MDFVGILRESIIGSIDSIISIAKVVVPLMIAIEFLKTLNILDKISNHLSPLTKFLGMSKNSAFPLLIGLILGLAFGAGVIIKSALDGEMSKRDLYLLMIFLVSCHSVFEDTLIFVALGANGWLLLGIRLTVAIILTFVSSKYIRKIVPNN